MDAEIMLEHDIRYFFNGERGNKKFFSRLGGEPDFNGLRVLDVGCGHGSLCVHIASMGARHVIGIDIDAKRIDFAQENIKQNYPELCDRMVFKHLNINELDEYDFDIIVSKDSFEHIIGLEQVMAEIIKRLKTGGGRLLIGFGPLYNSYYGDHKRTGSIIPWGHLIRSEKNIVKKINKKREPSDQITSIYDLGLNTFSLKQYKELFYHCGLQVIFFRVNVSNHVISKLFTGISKIPFLTEYFSHNIYCILEKN